VVQRRLPAHVAATGRQRHLQPTRDQPVRRERQAPDGSYDHVTPPIVNASRVPADVVTGPGRCGGDGVPILAGQQGRCGHGSRLPLLVISPGRLGRIGDGSFDARSGLITGMFDVTHRSAATPLFLDPQTGLPVPRARPPAPGDPLPVARPRPDRGALDRPLDRVWETPTRAVARRG
jgi:hypothetical protein